MFFNKNLCGWSVNVPDTKINHSLRCNPVFRKRQRTLMSQRLLCSFFPQVTDITCKTCNFFNCLLVNKAVHKKCFSVKAENSRFICFYRVLSRFIASEYSVMLQKYMLQNVMLQKFYPKDFQVTAFQALKNMFAVNQNQSSRTAVFFYAVAVSASVWSGVSHGSAIKQSFAASHVAASGGEPSGSRARDWSYQECQTVEGPTQVAARNLVCQIFDFIWQWVGANLVAAQFKIKNYWIEF